jgi:glycosyltransferase involved in cell wall biosynthesis
MKVIISVGGKFHAFYLAKELYKNNYLLKLFTSYPYYIINKDGLPRDKVVSLPLKEIFERVCMRIPFFSDKVNLQYQLSNIYDTQVSKYIEPSDIFVGWSSFSLYTFQKISKFRTIKIIERGSSHIEYQRDILKEEYEKLKIKPKLPDPRIVDKEIKEYEEADYISIPSEFVKQSFLKKGIPENKLIHIPYGVEFTEFKQVSKRDNVFRIIYVGTMRIRKGIHYLLRAFSELKLPNTELILIGSLDKEMAPFFNKYKGTYKWIPSVPQNILYKYYSQGSVFVIMSIEEGLSMVIPQAMACGLPVICTTNTGGKDIIREGIEGFIIPIRNVEKLKEKILYLYENPDICKSMGESAKIRVNSGFTWKDYGKKIIHAYKRILSQR